MPLSPYRWQHHHPDPSVLVSREQSLDSIITTLRAGAVVKLVGGRGMGKTVLLGQIQARFAGEADTRALRIPKPPGVPTVQALVEDLARRLGVPNSSGMDLDSLMEAVDGQGVRRVILLIDEVDQYVLMDEDGALARQWFNSLEALRKEWIDRVSIVVAGGLGLLHLGHVLGSGLVSRADTHLLAPFDDAELARLAEPLHLAPSLLALLATLSGGIPALATYGLEQVWISEQRTSKTLEDAFAAFPLRHADFIRAIHDGVSHRGLTNGPGKVLEIIRGARGPVARKQLADACASDDVDISQAVQLLHAAGLVRIEGSPLADPLHVELIASILHLPSKPSAVDDPIDRALCDVQQVLARIHRLGRDFRKPAKNGGLLHEDTFSSVLTVGLQGIGWTVTREAVQGGGYADLCLSQPLLAGHILLEIKLWKTNAPDKIEDQLRDYSVTDTLRRVAVVFTELPDRSASYEQACLAGHKFERMPRPPDILAWWRVIPSDDTQPATDHFLVHVPKRTSPS